MPIVATASLHGTVTSFSPLPGEGSAGGRGAGGEGLRGTVAGPFSATLSGTVSRLAVESLSSPSVAYNFAINLNNTWVPPTDLQGPVEIDESTDTPAVLFSFSLVGRRWSVAATSATWTAAPVEVWVTAGPIGPMGSLRTWRRAFGYVISCEQLEGIEPTVRVKCGDPSRLYARIELCYELPADAGLTRGAICSEILAEANLTATIPDGALYRKPIVTDSQRLWEFLHAFGEPETWSWRFTDWENVEAYQVALREHPEPPDDVWTLRDVVSIQTAPPTDVPSRWIIRSTQVLDGPPGITIRKKRTEVRGLYAIKRAVSQQLGDGSLEPIPGSSTEWFRLISALEEETHEQNGRILIKTTHQWGYYNPRAAKLRTPFEGEPPGPIEDGYYWSQAFIDEEGRYVTWRQEAFVLTGRRREIPRYDADGTEIGRRIETFRWHGRPMATRTVGSSVPNVLGAGVGDDDRSWFPFEKSLTSLLRIENFGLAQLDEIAIQYGATGAAETETQETWTWYSARTATQGVPWYINYSGAGQKDLVAPFQRYTQKTTANLLTEDGLLSGTVETSLGWTAPKRVEGAFDWGDLSSNLSQETWGTVAIKTTSYNILDESSYEELVDDGTGARPRLVMGRAPRPRYRASTWTTLAQAPLEAILEDPVVEDWFGPSTEVLALEYVQTPAEALAVAHRRRTRKLAHTHTVIRPICPTRPGDTILLIDPRSGILHRCLVTRLQERWVLSPRPQILATYTLEQPL